MKTKKSRTMRLAILAVLLLFCLLLLYIFSQPIPEFPLDMAQKQLTDPNYATLLGLCG